MVKTRISLSGADRIRPTPGMVVVRRVYPSTCAVHPVGAAGAQRRLHPSPHILRSPAVPPTSQLAEGGKANVVTRGGFLICRRNQTWKKPLFDKVLGRVSCSYQLPHEAVGEELED